MAAVIHIRNGHGLDGSAHPVANATPPELRLLDGGRSATARRMRRVYLVRRLVVVTASIFVLAIVVSVVGAAFSGTGSGAAGPARSVGAPAGVHVVQSGDTLWSIASSLDPAADPRFMVQRLLELNASQGELGATGHLRIGQELNVPARAS